MVSFYYPYDAILIGDDSMFKCVVNDNVYTFNWYMTIDEIKELFKDVSLEEIAEDYFVLKGLVFQNNAEKMIGLHFALDQLVMIELYNDKEVYKADDFIQTVQESRELLIQEYGTPTKESNVFIQLDGREEKTVFDNAFWETEEGLVEHYVMDRFGAEEHILITPLEK
jgi:hypothetical protein